MVARSEEDPWLGALYQFPTVLHARASFSFDVNLGTLQKAVVAALSSLLAIQLRREITMSNRVGYSEGKVSFRIGIGNGDGFDILDRKEVERVLSRIENIGPFQTLDVSFHLRYTMNDTQVHRVRGDEYLVRLVFQPERAEVLVHHLRGVRRMEPEELIGLVIRKLNSRLSRDRYSEVEVTTISST